MSLKTIFDYHSSMLPDGMLQSRAPSALPQVIPVFALYFVFMLEDYYIQTGDASIPRRFRPTVDAVLDYFDRHIDESGLANDLGYWDFGDWCAEWSFHGTPNAALSGPSTIHNLVYAYALQSAARQSLVTGRPGTADEYSTRANTILKNVQNSCWDQERGLLREGPDFHEYSQHAQCMAVLTGLIEGEEARNLLRRTAEDKTLIRCTYPWMFALLRAYESAGLYELAGSAMASVKSMLDLNLTTLAEMPADTRSDCHAWSAFPLYELPRVYLGVQPGAPGWKIIRVKPVYAGLADISGSVYTPKGHVQLKVRWQDGQLSVKGTAPKGTCLQLVMPDGMVKVYEQGGAFEG